MGWKLGIRIAFYESLHIIDLVTTADGINNSIKNFLNHVDGICKPLFGKENKPSVNNRFSFIDNKHMCPTRFDETCETKRKCYYQCLNVYRHNKSNENRIHMINARKEYKNSVRNFNINFAKSKTDKLIKAKYKNAKLYWKLLKGAVSNNQPKHLSFNTFTQYFQSVNNPNDPVFQVNEDIAYFNDNIRNTELNTMFLELDCEFIDKK